MEQICDLSIKELMDINGGEITKETSLAYDVTYCIVSAVKWTLLPQ